MNPKDPLSFLFEMNCKADSRGTLCPIDFQEDLPFVPERVFLTYKFIANTIRGDHAHRTCSQFLIAISGRIEVTLYDGWQSTSFVLENPRHGLLIPPMNWCVLHDASEDMILLAFASEKYEENEYIRIFQEFLSLN